MTMNKLEMNLTTIRSKYAKKIKHLENSRERLERQMNQYWRKEQGLEITIRKNREDADEIADKKYKHIYNIYLNDAIEKINYQAQLTVNKSKLILITISLLFLMINIVLLCYLIQLI